MIFRHKQDGVFGVCGDIARIIIDLRAPTVLKLKNQLKYQIKVFPERN
jgi:hypothetical protein